jgi:hypothetical protein
MGPGDPLVESRMVQTTLCCPKTLSRLLKRPGWALETQGSPSGSPRPKPTLTGPGDLQAETKTLQTTLYPMQSTGKRWVQGSSTTVGPGDPGSPQGLGPGDPGNNGGPGVSSLEEIKQTKKKQP